MTHLVLLGDSIFDNAAYVGRGPAVIDQVRNRLPGGSRASLRAIDGSTTDAIAGQLSELPPDASHLVVSMGGNDALMQSSLLNQATGSVAEALSQLYAVVAGFEQEYRAAMSLIIACRLPTLVCTIYNPHMPDPAMQQVYSAALCLFNDVIIRVVCEYALPLLDLRQVCTNAEDYANPIEPSSIGGAKIADAVTQIVARHDFSLPHTIIYGR